MDRNSVAARTVSTTPLAEPGRAAAYRVGVFALIVLSACAKPPAQSAPDRTIPPPAPAIASQNAALPADPGPAPSGDTWSEVARFDIAQGAVSSGVVTQNRLCFGGLKPPSLSCVDLASGKRVVHIQHQGDWLGGQLAVDGDRLYQVYGAKGRVIVHQVDVRTGRVARAIEHAVPNANVNPRALSPSPGKLMVAFRSGAPPTKSGAALVIDTQLGRVVNTFAVPGISDLVARRDSLAIFSTFDGGVGGLSAIDFTTGAALWNFQGKKRQYFAGYAVLDGTVLLHESNNAAMLLDAKSGRKLRALKLSQSGDRGGAAQPLVTDSDVFLVGDQLYRLGHDLAVRAKTNLDTYLREPMLLLENELIVHDLRSVFVLDRETLALKARLESSEDYQLTDLVLDGRDGLVATAVQRYNHDSRTRFLHLRRVATGTLDLSELAGDASLYFQRKPLLRGARLPHGRHEFAILRRGFAPITFTLAITAGQTSKLPPLRFDKLPAEPQRLPADRLPPGRTLASLPTSAVRLVAYPERFVKSYESHRDGQLAAAWSDRLGLAVLDAATGTLSFERPADSVLADLDPSLPARMKARTPRAPRVELGGFAPSEGLAFLLTEGALDNTLAAFEIDSGRPRWRAPLALGLPVMESKSGGYFTSTFWVAHGLFWHRDTHVLYGRDLKTGRLVLERYEGHREGHYSELLFDVEGLVFTHHDRLKRIALFDQKLDWSLRVPEKSELYWAPDQSETFVVSERQVRRVSKGGQVLATSPALAGNIDDNPAIIDDDLVFVCGHFRSQTYALRRKDLSLAWTYRERSGSSPCPTLVDATDVLIADGDTRILLDKKSGRVKAKLGELPFSGRPKAWFASGGQLCVAEHDGTRCIR